MKPLDPFHIDLEKITLIEASAGTGKTYTITTLYCRLVAEGYPVESMMSLSSNVYMTLCERSHE